MKVSEPICACFVGGAKLAAPPAVDASGPNDLAVVPPAPPAVYGFGPNDLAVVPPAPPAVYGFGPDDLVADDLVAASLAPLAVQVLAGAVHLFAVTGMNVVFALVPDKRQHDDTSPSVRTKHELVGHAVLHPILNCHSTTWGQEFGSQSCGA
eukprot:CAMPEP_0180677000 /NCGR_PEP_ID=MMETSP1037_2-20121125/67620_1 /TAXON_ID=632150 /ORGANISM="Azadinium spinosum, Strain 3D9" /LENGTH=151 /DNA_ID=CAMNT_0022706557 /DNA_START=788 /DNA_END=1245 /DNA_ORIENTATION=+